MKDLEQRIKELGNILNEKKKVQVPEIVEEYGQQYGKCDFGEYYIGKREVYVDRLVHVCSEEEREQAYRELNGIMETSEQRYF